MVSGHTNKLNPLVLENKPQTSKLQHKIHEVNSDEKMQSELTFQASLPAPSTPFHMTVKRMSSRFWHSSSRESIVSDRGRVSSPPI